MLKEYPGAEPALKHEHSLSKTAEWLLIGGVAAALLIPCFWQPHIQASDLASHVYNAWLAPQVERGAIPGLVIAHPVTNVLVDWALEPLVNQYGRDAAERLVASAAVEIFFWGAFCFVCSVSGRRAWVTAPSLAMLTYGVIFHFGFLNNYVSAGLAFWILALLWEPSWRRASFAIPLAILAFLAHALPFVWVVGMLAYLYAFRWLPQNQRSFLLLAGICVLFLIQLGLGTFYATEWSWDQLLSLNGFLNVTGASQFWLFGTKYLIVVAAILLLWFLLFLERLDVGDLISDPLLHLWIMTVAAIVILPSSIVLPLSDHINGLIPYRLSLFAVVLFCAVVSQARHGRRFTSASLLIAGVFFTSLYLDVREFNRMEAKVTELVSALPPGQRVVASMADRRSNLNGVSHVADGACLGRCFSYGNYEPASRQFRVRATGPNQAAASTNQAVHEIEYGGHVVTQEEAPIYSVCLSPGDSGKIELRRLQAGELTCHFELSITSQIF